MRRIVSVLTLVGLGLSSLRGAELSRECEEAKRNNRWCEAANAGYVASVEIRSRFLYEALDAHGHDIEPAAVTCQTCRMALESDGFCPAHRMGFVGGKAYLSRLTYHLARSRAVEPEAITCRVCRRHARGIGWCDKHRVGIAGRIAIDDRQAFKEFSEAYEILLAAIGKQTECETCAVAMVADGYCPTHRVKYEHGRTVPASSP